jgi:MoxR-like ATPase
MKPLVSQEALFKARDEVLDIYIAPLLEEYVVQLAVATRDPSPYGDDLKSWINYGASPRATIALDRCAKAHAWLSNRDYVSPADIHAVAPDVLRHRILLSFSAEAGGITTDKYISELLARVPVP